MLRRLKRLTVVLRHCNDVIDIYIFHDCVALAHVARIELNLSSQCVRQHYRIFLFVSYFLLPRSPLYQYVLINFFIAEIFDVLCFIVFISYYLVLYMYFNDRSNSCYTRRSVANIFHNHKYRIKCYNYYTKTEPNRYTIYVLYITITFIHIFKTKYE